MAKITEMTPRDQILGEVLNRFYPHNSEKTPEQHVIEEMFCSGMERYLSDNNLDKKIYSPSEVKKVTQALIEFAHTMMDLLEQMTSEIPAPKSKSSQLHLVPKSNKQP